ncbi:cytochrome d ubiquinol oxidase subunit II [Porticoccaceae bacterium LTM1]|nr:cytochrome d ubiquinol oxidase subunit II [Porticoccaceae bacterium LTM1]
MNEATIYPLIFAGLMALAMLIYAILDGYDLGVGILLPFSKRGENDAQRDRMIASIGPFWDANETWLVLAVGILLVAFPKAHGIILGELYLPTAALLAGLILRGVSFDFRAKAMVTHKRMWDHAFRIGSLMATLAQGYMFGRYVHGFADSTGAIIFAWISAICMTAGYHFIGACWLIMKTDGQLQGRAAKWARRSLWFMAAGILAVCIVNPLVSERIFEKWLSIPNIILLAPIPLMTFFLVIAIDRFLKKFPRIPNKYCWVPFAGAVFIFLLSFHGLAYSFYPFIVPEQLTIWDAASATASLKFMLVGVAITVPAIIGYTIYSYRVFWGKAQKLCY